MRASCATTPARVRTTWARNLGQRGHDVDCTTYCYAPHLVGPLFDRAATALLRPTRSERERLASAAAKEDEELAAKERQRREANGK